MKFLNVALISVILSTGFFANVANADLILSDSTVVNTSGQYYSKTFDVTGLQNYTDLVFTVNARGDYGISPSAEFIEFLIDNTSFGIFHTDTAGVNSSIGPTGKKDFDHIMDFSFTISDLDWNTLFANDSQLKIEWRNSQNVGHDFGYYVNYSLSATEVPEPTTLAIFALALVGLATRRFKKKS